MKIVLYKNGKYINSGYKHVDISKPILSLAKGYQYYYVEEIKPQITDVNRYYLRLKGDVLTTEKHQEYAHFLKLVKEWELVEYPKSVVIEKLNDSLGQHLDSLYAPWKRQKHTDELTSDTITNERKTYIRALKAWEVSQRELRDQRETEYTNNNIFPSFEWDGMPNK